MWYRSVFHRVATQSHTFAASTPLRRCGTAMALSVGVTCVAGVGSVTGSTSSSPSTPSKAARTKKWTYYSGGIPLAKDDVKIIAGNANPELAAEVSELLGLPLTKTNVGKYSDGETSIQILENIRDQHVFILQPTCQPVNDNLVELLLLISTARRASARQITAVIPYFGYARMDKKMVSRVPIAAADVALMLEVVGADNVITIDLHAGQIQGFFSPQVPVENLEATSVGALYFAEHYSHIRNPVICSPDAGGVPRAKKYRQVLADLGHDDTDFAFLIEQRQPDTTGHLLSDDNEKQIDLVGDVKGRSVILVEDIIDTGATLERAAQKLKAEGAKDIYAFSTHGLFTNTDKIKSAPIKEIVVSNTIPMPKTVEELGDKIKQLSLAPLLSEAIRRVYERKSLGKLFEMPTQAAAQTLKEVEEQSNSHPTITRKVDQ